MGSSLNLRYTAQYQHSDNEMDEVWLTALIVDKPIGIPLVGAVIEFLRPLTEEIRHIGAVHLVKEANRSVPRCDKSIHAVISEVKSMSERVG